jgi:hypothetical protein
MSDMKKSSRERLARQERAKAESAEKAKRTYGRLTGTDYQGLLRDLQEARANRRELADEAVRAGSKVAALLETEGAFWWLFYELPFAHHLAVLCIRFGWLEKLKDAAAKDNPTKSFLELVAKQEEADNNPFDSLPPDQQAIVLNLLIGVLCSIDSARFFGLSINELLAKAENGDQESLLRAASIDRCVLATSAGSAILATAQLRRDKLFISRLAKRLKAPHAGRAPYGDLRLLHRVLDETGALGTLSRDELWDLVGPVLQMYSTRKGDQKRSLGELFRTWEKDAAK